MYSFFLLIHVHVFFGGHELCILGLAFVLVVFVSFVCFVSCIVAFGKDSCILVLSEAKEMFVFSLTRCFVSICNENSLCGVCNP